jgi:hypothetical protein
MKGYTNLELTLAVNKTLSIPPLGTIELLQVLYRCDDTAGDLTGNVFCIAGCISDGDDTVDDMCVM